MSFRLLTLITLLLFCSISVFAQNYVIKPGDEITRLSGKDILPNEKKGAYYNEFWNYHFALDNGAEIYLNYSINHFGGMRDAVSVARMSLLNWEGENYKAAREYDLEKLIFEEDSYKMNLNPERGIWFEGKLPESHKIHYRTNKNGIHFDINLDFESIEKGFTWGDGIFFLGDSDKVGMFTHIPGAKISGFVALDFDTVRVTGTAFMAQTYQTNVSRRLFSESFRFSKKIGDKNIGGYFLIPKEAVNEVVGYAFESRNGKIILKKPISLVSEATDTFMGERISSRIKVCYEEHPCDIIEVVEMNEKIAMLDELRGLKKTFAKRFLGGDIIELRGKAILNSDTEVFYNLTVLD